MNFGDALEALKSGERVARKGWNGKGMWLILIPGAGFMEGYEVQDAIAMKTANDLLQPGWLASQNDMLAEDYYILDEE